MPMLHPYPCRLSLALDSGLVLVAVSPTWAAAARTAGIGGAAQGCVARTGADAPLLSARAVRMPVWYLYECRGAVGSRMDHHRDRPPRGVLWAATLSRFRGQYPDVSTFALPLFANEMEGLKGRGEVLTVSALHSVDRVVLSLITQKSLGICRVIHSDKWTLPHEQNENHPSLSPNYSASVESEAVQFFRLVVSPPPTEGPRCSGVIQSDILALIAPPPFEIPAVIGGAVGRAIALADISATCTFKFKTSWKIRRTDKGKSETSEPKQALVVVHKSQDTDPLQVPPRKSQADQELSYAMSQRSDSGFASA
ncbi:hypothetical protein M427DRAFT_148560 [Gonapodya prolifera JEL478]|uniref:Uncharacterized protein n=1 Tax=Gonapodya prolifera (strain JEL478) TaxID=1344416 RepID=A0A139A1E7_GONPJ|nr:hypothetical protein M427DRAFT_148560 [Gonapodya prolifera JEL478]|eukprot:KXS10561.1 hypothetical protein M427DRAFT_148560 [Gonapodya prolifera JEL478]